MRVAGARRREDSARCLGSSSPCCCRIHTIAYHGHGSGKWSKVWGRASNTTRRRGANPSPRSWPRICGANALGGLAKRGRVRCGTLLHGQKIRRRHAGDALRVVSVTSEPSSRAFRRPPAPHPAFLRNATQSICSANAGPASWRGICAASSRQFPRCVQMTATSRRGTPISGITHCQPTPNPAGANASTPISRSNREGRRFEQCAR